MTDERKEFDCPSCGGKSLVDMATLVVEHLEPKCAAWLEIEAKQSTAPEPAPRSGVQQSAAGACVDFACPDCGNAARMFPGQVPIAVEHSLPVCKLWQAIEGKKDDVERFLIKAGVHVHVPDRE